MKTYRIHFTTSLITVDATDEDEAIEMAEGIVENLIDNGKLCLHPHVEEVQPIGSKRGSDGCHGKKL
jgi:hypothetical protein